MQQLDGTQRTVMLWKKPVTEAQISPDSPSVRGGTSK